MSKYNIKCITWNKEQKEIFVTSDSKVWPCCNYTSAELNPNDRNNLDDDPYVANLRKTDPNWNNCSIAMQVGQTLIVYRKYESIECRAE
jgi:hypothetical protein